MALRRTGLSAGTVSSASYVISETPCQWCDRTEQNADCVAQADVAQADIEIGLQHDFSRGEMCYVGNSPRPVPGNMSCVNSRQSRARDFVRRTEREGLAFERKHSAAMGADQGAARGLPVLEN
jgi:hypothetical protein